MTTLALEPTLGNAIEPIAEPARRDSVKEFLAAGGCVVIPLASPVFGDSAYPVPSCATRQLYGHTEHGWWRIPKECRVGVEIERTPIYLKEPDPMTGYAKPITSVLTKEAYTVAFPDGRRLPLFVDPRQEDGDRVLKYYEVYEHGLGC